MSVRASERYIPRELISLTRWFRWEYREANSKRTKIPLTVDGKPASTRDHSTWTTFDNVKRFDKIGFVFCKEDGFLGIDLDHVIRNESLLSWAESIIRSADSYTEFSPSGEGLHTIGFGIKPEWMPSRIDMPSGSGLEVYDSGRYFTMTGNMYGNFSKVNKIDATLICDFLKPSAVEGHAGQSRLSRGEALRVSIHSVIAGFKEEENTTHPFHDSTTGANFRIDKGGETWRCWRHGVTGNALHLLGIEEGIIHCGDKPTKEQWREILHAAKSRGLVLEEKSILVNFRRVKKDVSEWMKKRGYEE